MRTGVLSPAAASRAGSISPVAAPGPGGVLVRPDDRRVHCHRPRRAVRLIAAGAQPVQDLLPRPVAAPAAVPVIDRLPVPEPPGQIPPRAPRPGPEENPVQDQPVIIPPMSLPRMGRQQRFQPRPLRITEVMPLQPVHIHGVIQAETTTKIYGTRSSGVPAELDGDAVLGRGRVRDRRDVLGVRQGGTVLLQRRVGQRGARASPRPDRLMRACCTTRGQLSAGL